jgi:hypothetical protein
MPKAAKEKKFSIPKQTKFDTKTHTTADHVMREEDRVTRWKKIHDLLRKQNKKARKEQDVTAKDCAYFRKHGLVRKDKTDKMGLRWGVSLPPMTYHAIVQADRLIDGHSDLANPDKEATESLRGSNKIVKDLEQAFPQYKVS